jgi:hypothetical protein
MNTTDVSADRGLAWLSEGWRLFQLNIGMWIVLFVIYFVIIVVAHGLPLVGWLIGPLVTPGLIAGMLGAARELDEGRDIAPETLFAPFQDARKRTALVTLGGIYLAGVVGLMVLGLSVGATAALGGMLFGGAGAAAAGLGTGAIFFLLATVVWAAFACVVFLAVPLVAFRDVAPMDALRQSLDALVRHWIPLLVYSVITFVLAVVASVPAFLGWLVLGPVLFASLYASYKDLFPAAGAAAPVVVSPGP